MLYIIGIYVIILMVIGLLDYKKIRDFDDYVVAGKKQKLVFVYLSLMATMIGASATIGIADRVVQIGFPAFWWLGVGAVGLILQSVLISKKVRALDAKTLPDVANKTVGKGGKTLLGAIIAVSWVGIIAAQFVSITKIISIFMSDVNTKTILIVISVIVVLYTVIGGQLSVVKTDSIQSIIIGIGIIFTFVYIMFFTESDNSFIKNNTELLNDSFNAMDLFNLLMITGGTYFIGPDIISRNLMSKDGKVAKKAALLSGISIAVYGVIVSLIGLWAVNNITDMGSANPLIYIMNNILPKPVAILLCLALISTLLSTADTCLINAASIIEYDLLKRDKIKEIRGIVAVLGIASLIIALYKTDIIGLLTGTYSIYAPGVVFPLTVAVMAHNKRKICKPLWYLSVIFGGSFGIANAYFNVGFEFLPLVGMGVSMVFSIMSVLPVFNKTK